MQLAYATTILTSKPRIGSEVATTQIRQALASAGAELHTFGFHRRGAEEPGMGGSTVIDVRPIETANAPYRRLRWGIESLLMRRAYSERKYHSRRWRIAGEYFQSCDTVVIDHSQLGFLHSFVRGGPQRVIGVMHNVEWEMYAETADHASGVWPLIFGREARHMRDVERELAENVDETWIFTEADAERVRKLAPSAATRVLPLTGNPVHERAVPAERDGIRLIGTWTWRPNREALSWFLQDVVPLLPRGVNVTVAGPGGEWIPSSGAVRYTGFVPDALDFLAGAGAVAIPTLSGGGIQIKTLDALSVGVPVAATPIALRGIEDAPPTVHVGESPRAFADALERALEQPADVKGGRDWAAERRRRFERAVAEGIGL
jgi:glycosyltransferase involved in cell wall biosynthesis